jgi:signal transduction protein with GAF and PtsI domain
LRVQLDQTGAAARIGDALAAAAIAEEIVAPATHQRLLEMIVETAASVISAKAGALFLIDEEAGDLVFQVALGGSADEVKNIRVPLGHGIAGGVALSGLPLAVSNVSSDRRWAKDIGEKADHVPASIVCVPLFYGTA